MGKQCNKFIKLGLFRQIKRAGVISTVPFPCCAAMTAQRAKSTTVGEHSLPAELPASDSENTYKHTQPSLAYYKNKPKQPATALIYWNVQIKVTSHRSNVEIKQIYSALQKLPGLLQLGVNFHHKSEHKLY